METPRNHQPEHSSLSVLSNLQYSFNQQENSALWKQCPKITSTLLPESRLPTASMTFITTHYHVGYVTCSATEAKYSTVQKY